MMPLPMLYIWSSLEIRSVVAGTSWALTEEIIGPIARPGESGAREQIAHRHKARRYLRVMMDSLRFQGCSRAIQCVLCAEGVWFEVCVVSVCKCRIR